MQRSRTAEAWTVHKIAAKQLRLSTVKPSEAILAIGNIALCGTAIMTLRVGDTWFVDRAGNDRAINNEGDVL
jgi:hypothetical protein